MIKILRSPMTPKTINSISKKKRALNLNFILYTYQQPRKNLIIPNGFSMTCHVTNKYLQVVKSLNEFHNYLLLLTYALFCLHVGFSPHPDRSTFLK